MNHLISEITILNFRSCKDITLKLNCYTPFVGYNNAGKSNCLSAIQWLLRRTTLTRADFFDDSQPIEVIAKIDNISQEIIQQMPNNQKKSIEPYLDKNSLRIKRTQPSPNCKASEIRLSIWSDIDGDWKTNPTGIDNAISTILPEPIRINAMEDAVEDASKSRTSTTIGKLLAQFLEPVKNAHDEELTKYLSEVNNRISCDGSKRFSELSIIDEKINKKIDTLFSGVKVKLHFDTPKFDDLIKAGTIKVYEEPEKGRDFSSYGHGTQRAIQMALIQYLAEEKRTEKPQHTNTLLLIDEPELYLHPTAIEQVREALIKLSENGYQVIISTHSAQFVTPEYAQNTVLICKDQSRGTYARSRLIDAIQKIVPKSLHQEQLLFSLSHVSQIFFSENVVLTEGKTELRLFPFIFHKINGYTLGQSKLALVTQTGANDTRKSLEILKAMDIPAKAIVDLDYSFTSAIKDGFLQEDDSDLLKLKEIFERLAPEKSIVLNKKNGLPEKNSSMPTAKAYKILSEEDDAKPFIESLHNKMKSKNIWLWTKGTIESHIGLSKKNEEAWAVFKKDVNERGIDNVLEDYEGVASLIRWLVT